MATVCDRILGRDKRIGSAMLVDSEGHIVEWKMRGPLLMPKEDVATFAGIWTIVVGGVVKQMEKYFGKSEFNSLGYEKLTVYRLPFGDRAIVITARKDIPLEIVLSLKEITEDQTVQR